MPEPARIPDYATKADLDLLEARLRRAIAEIMTDVAKQISDLKSELYRMILTTLIAMTAIFGGLVAMLKLYG